MVCGFPVRSRLHATTLLAGMALALMCTSTPSHGRGVTPVAQLAPDDVKATWG